MSFPATTPAGAVFVIERSACATTVVLTLCVLLPDGSVIPATCETVALLVTTPPFGGATMLMVRGCADCPLASEEAVHVMVPPGPAWVPHDQPVPEPTASVAPVGIVSTTVIVPLVFGPAFEMVIV